MLQIYKPIDSIIKAAGKQKVKEKTYRFLTYVHHCEVDNGMLVYNIMTRELLFLTKDEAKDFINCNILSVVGKYLAENWFLVPEKNDDFLLFCQLDGIFRLVSSRDKNAPIKTFVIFPTTDCNARCFYCFELGCKRINMTEQTAHDVADFIIKKSQANPVHLLWFGGEPLYNTTVIDIITEDLSVYGIEFESQMVSNGYLFNDLIVKKAVNKWKLKLIQITLDGTEEVYNKTKNYIYKNDPSPFLRVLKNIECLLKSNVLVQIRLNMDESNCDDLKQLVIQLSDRFSKYEKFMVYVSFICEFKGEISIPRSEETQILLYKKFHEINDILGEISRESKQVCTIHRFANQCMADSNTSTTILPDGKLGKCEHFIDDNYYGSIYSDEIDYRVINKFKEMTEVSEECHRCIFAPFCRSLKHCSHAMKVCYDVDKKEAKSRVEQIMRNSYEKFLSKDGLDDNGADIELYNY